MVRETQEKNSPSRRMETDLLKKGQRIWLGFNTALLKDRQGKSLGVILSFSDLTEVKRLQEQIELKERLTALGEMSAGIAHELRNPMAVIAGYLSLLAKKQDDAGQAVMRHLLESCLGTVLQARTGGSPVGTVLDILDVTAPVDEVLMRQALGNLIQNAVEAMPDGGTLTVITQVDRDLTIIVGDTGPGIPPSNLKKVFLPFFTTKDNGVGMGLALTHKVVTAHGGRVDVESKEGAGTKFTVVLPTE
jgi:signal transduction histidine kinase